MPTSWKPVNSQASSFSIVRRYKTMTGSRDLKYGVGLADRVFPLNNHGPLV